MNDEGPRVGKERGVFGSQPDFEMCEGAVPVKYLDEESKCKAREMEYLDHLIFDSPEGAQEKKHDPEKMKEDNKIRKNLIEHSYLSIYHRKAFLQEKVW
jgi:hypothetical protein